MKLKIKPLVQACALSLLAGSAIATTPAGTMIINKVVATYQDAAGNRYSSESNVINLTIREVYAAALTPGNGAKQEVSVTDKEVISSHTLKNTGNVKQEFKLVASNAEDDTIDGKIAIYLDKDGSGDLSEEEINAGEIASITLEADEVANLILVTTLPGAIKESDTLHITLTVTDSKGNIVTDVNDVIVSFKSLDDNLTDADVMIMPTGPGSTCNAYAWIQEAVNWQEAKKRASNWIYRGKRGHLATLTTEAENAFLAEKLPDYGRWWIGAYRTKDGAAFTDRWITGEPFDYTNWWAGEPNNSGEKALEFAGNGQWNDFVDTYGRHYLVEFELGACPDAPKPKVEVSLAAAKDLTCDGEPDDEFGDVDLTEMASGECVIMHVRAENTSNEVARKIHVKQAVPTHASYVPNSITLCGSVGTECVDLTPRTDDASDTDAGYYDENSGVIGVGGDYEDLKPGAIWHAEYRLKID